MLCHPCILGGPQTKGDKIRSGYLTPASKAQKRVEMLGPDCESLIKQCSANGGEAYTEKSATMSSVGTDDTL